MTSRGVMHALLILCKGQLVYLEALLDDIKGRHACVADNCGSRPSCSSPCEAGLRRRLAQALLCCLVDCKVHRMRRSA